MTAASSHVSIRALVTAALNELTFFDRKCPKPAERNNQTKFLKRTFDAPVPKSATGFYVHLGFDHVLGGTGVVDAYADTIVGKLTNV